MGHTQLGFLEHALKDYHQMCTRKIPLIHDHPILLTDFQVAQVMALVECYQMLGKQHSSEARAEWGQIAYQVIYDVLSIMGIKIPRENFQERL